MYLSVCGLSESEKEVCGRALAVFDLSRIDSRMRRCACGESKLARENVKSKTRLEGISSPNTPQESALAQEIERNEPMEH